MIRPARPLFSLLAAFALAATPLSLTGCGGPEDGPIAAEEDEEELSDPAPDFSKIPNYN